LNENDEVRAATRNPTDANAVSALQAVGEVLLVPCGLGSEKDRTAIERLLGAAASEAGDEAESRSLGATHQLAASHENGSADGQAEKVPAGRTNGDLTRRALAPRRLQIRAPAAQRHLDVDTFWGSFPSLRR
jgi:hypothetical protein